MYPKYNEDFYGWAMASADLLKRGQFSQLDLENLVEEIETLGRSTKREFVSRLGVLIAHLLKWQHQSSIRTQSWKSTIKLQRIEISNLIEESPSIKSVINESMKKSYKYSLTILTGETPIDLKTIPSACPYSFEQLLDEDFYPESAH